VHALKLLRKNGVPAYVRLVNGGNDAARAVRALGDCNCVVLVDAVCCGLEPGKVHSMSSGELSSRGAHLSNHGASLLNMIEFERVAGAPIEDVHVVGMEPATMHFGMGLSECCRLNLPDLVQAVREKLESYTA
jgi:hydrogenase maturation protease